MGPNNRRSCRNRRIATKSHGISGQSSHFSYTFCGTSCREVSPDGGVCLALAQGQPEQATRRSASRLAAPESCATSRANSAGSRRGMDLLRLLNVGKLWGLALSTASAIVLIVLLAACGSSESSTAQNQEWYEGGTLHQRTAEEWVEASYRNRLATSADFATAMLKSSIVWDDIDSIEDIRPYATAIKTCIDEAYGPAPPLPQLENAETAAICWTLMYSHLG